MFSKNAKNDLAPDSQMGPFADFFQAFMTHN